MNLNDIVKIRFANSAKVLQSKGEQYKSDTDRYYQFNEAAKIMNVSAAVALLGMQVKHLTPVLDMALKELKSSYSGDLEKLEEKSGDLFNYYILLAGLNQEEQDLNAVLKEIEESYNDKAIEELEFFLDHDIEKLVDAFRRQHHYFVLKIKDKTFDWEIFGKLLGFTFIMEYRIREKLI